jgi:hypothetical protein
LVGLLAGAVAFSAIVPGLLGTIRGLFLNASSDPSTGGRTADYGPAVDYLRERPLFGRGFGTFLPELYRTLDNQYLAIVVEAGLVGVLATICLLGGTILVAARGRARMSSPEDRDLAQSLAAGIAVLAVSAGTFDLFGFSMSVGLMFLLIGSTGALTSFTVPPRGHRETSRPRPRELVAAGAVAGIVALGLMGLRMSESPEYDAVGTVILEPPAPTRTPALTSVGRAAVSARILHDVLESTSTRQELRLKGVEDYDLAVGDGSLMHDTDRQGAGALIHVIARSTSPASAQSALAKIVGTLTLKLTDIQEEINVPTTERITARAVSINPAFEVTGRPARFAGGLAIVSALSYCLALQALRRTTRAVVALSGPRRRELVS